MKLEIRISVNFWNKFTKSLFKFNYQSKTQVVRIALKSKTKNQFEATTTSVKEDLTVAVPAKIWMKHLKNNSSKALKTAQKNFNQ